MPLNRLVPITLRLSTLGLRFILIFFLARYLPVSEVGLYGLLTVTISYALYAIGFDFYTYSTREIIRSHRTMWRSHIRSHATFALVTGSVLAPALLALFVLGLLPWFTAPWFFGLLVLEYLSIEIDRALIAFQSQLRASIVLFVGGALTPLIVIPLITFVESLRRLPVVLASWCLFDIIAVMLGILFIARDTVGTKWQPADWPWIRAGIRVAIPFLVGTLSLRALFTFDRQFVKVFGDLDMVGAYTFYSAMAFGITQILYAAVYQFSYPKLIEAEHNAARHRFDSLLGAFALQTVIISALLSFALVAFRYPILRFVDDPIYDHFAWTLPWLVLIVSVYALSNVPHYALYALQADRPIIVSSMLSLAGFLATSVTAHAHGEPPVTAVLMGLSAGSSLLLVSKSAVYILLRVRRNATS